MTKTQNLKITYDQNNLLTRGQTVENVPFNETKPLLLKAGQLSLHHPKTVHSSGPNLSKKRRIGFAIQSYIATNVKQKIGKVFVQLARGKDFFKYHEHTTRPKERMNKKRNHARKPNPIHLAPRNFILRSGSPSL